MPTQNYLAQAEALCREHSATLLFLCFFGSRLYGTELPGKSDLDLRGMFLPSVQSLALHEAANNLHFSTAQTGSRNSQDDVDLDLWSLQYWLLQLLPAGDTGALDLLFAPSHPACVLYQDPRMEALLRNPEKLVNLESRRAVEYSLAQARKYGAKGARLAALQRVSDWLETALAVGQPEGKRLLPHIAVITAAAGDTDLCRLTESREGPALFLCNKLHQGSIRLVDFARRVQADLERYGARAEDAAQAGGADFKALSHALRAIYQMEALLSTGRIRFPLTQAEELKAIKAGQRSLEELGPYLQDKLVQVQRLQKATLAQGQTAFDPDFARRFVLSCYERREPDTSPPSLPVQTERFAPGFSVPQEARTEIAARLAQVERESTVRLLFACESGSRGWGFASKDSDFDVRFVYAHPQDWYLGLDEGRDVLELGIEETKAGVLDVNGWDLRKVLRLFRASNPVMLEWLNSPLVYLERGSLAERLRALAPEIMKPLALWHHYRGLMLKSRERFQEKAAIKTWFYMVRPLLAMHWLELGLGLPPMRFDLLADAVVQDVALRQELERLVELKKSGVEQERFVPPATISLWAESLMPAPDFQPALSASRAAVDWNALFCELLREVWTSPT